MTFFRDSTFFLQSRRPHGFTGGFFRRSCLASRPTSRPPLSSLVIVRPFPLERQENAGLGAPPPEFPQDPGRSRPFPLKLDGFIPRLLFFLFFPIEGGLLSLLPPMSPRVVVSDLRNGLRAPPPPYLTALKACLLLLPLRPAASSRLPRESSPPPFPQGYGLFFFIHSLFFFYRRNDGLPFSDPKHDSLLPPENALQEGMFLL